MNRRIGLDTELEKIKMTLSQILAACSVDKDFRNEFMANPRKVLDAFDVDFYPESDLKVVEVPFNTITIDIFPMVESTEEAR